MHQESIKLEDEAMIAPHEANIINTRETTIHELEGKAMMVPREPKCGSQVSSYMIFI